MAYRDFLTRRSISLLVLSLAAATTVVAAPGLFGDEIEEAFAGLADASPAWMWLGAAAFASAVSASGWAWRAGMRACGGELDRVDAAARYAAGSLTNALAPAGAGGAVRIALFARTLDSRDRLWTTGGVAAAVAVAKATALGAVVVVAAIVTGFPLWPVLALAALGAAAAGVAYTTRRRTASNKFAHVLDAFRALGRSPVAAARIVGWMTAATAARVLAAAAVAAALGAPSPLVAGLVAVPALALAGVVPLTPGNAGVASGAMAIALHLQGVDIATSMAVGIAFHALETAVSIVLGAGSLLYLGRAPRWSVRVATAATCLALVGGFGATVILPLV